MPSALWQFAWEHDRFREVLTLWLSSLPPEGVDGDDLPTANRPEQYRAPTECHAVQPAPEPERFGCSHPSREAIPAHPRLRTDRPAHGQTTGHPHRPNGGDSVTTQ